MADPSTCAPLTPHSIEDAHIKIAPFIHRTPLLTSKTLNKIASSPNPEVFLSDTLPINSDSSQRSNDVVPKFNLYFKAENLQRIGAFKARGAFHALNHLIETVSLPVLQEKGVVAHSSGNHAQAIALAANTFGIPSYIVMPAISTPSKILGAQQYAKEMIFSGPTSQDREAEMLKVKERTGAYFIPPFDHPDIVLGQGTVGKEMTEQFAELNQDKSKSLDAVIAPCGGGGLLSGVAVWFSDKPTKIFGAEPSFQGADDAKRGRDQGKRIEFVHSKTIADGLRMPVGLVNWEILSDKNRVEGIYTVTEREIKMAMRLVLERMKLVAEPSACTSLAVILFNKEFRKMVADAQQGEIWDVGIVLSGGNTTVKILSSLFSEGLESEKGKI